MRRRRGILRRRILPEIHLLGPGMRILRRAHALFARGAYSESAALFENLAVESRRRGYPRSFRLLLQAGRAAILAGNISYGVDLLLQGLKLLYDQDMTDLAQQRGEQLIVELGQQGLHPEAERVKTWMESVGLDTGSPGKISDGRISGFPALPPNCPGCGAPLRPDEVDWIDPQTAVCEFCGSVVRGESR